MATPNFNPLEYGATPVNDFDPISFGAVPVDDGRKAKVEGYKLEAERAQKEAKKSIFRRFVEETPNTLVGIPARFVTSAIESPYTFATGKATQKEYDLPGLDPFKSFQSESESRIMAGANPLGEIGKKALSVPLAGLETLGLAKAGVSLTKGAQSLFKGRADARALKQALDITKPTLSSKEEIIAKEAGRFSKKGISGKISLAPNDRDVEVAEAVKDVVKKGDPFKNIQRIRSKIAEISDDEVRGAIKANDSIFNNNQLNSKLGIAKEDSDLLFAGDAAKEKAYNATINFFKGLVNKKGNKTSGLFEARIEFDQLMKQKFGRDILDPTKSKDIVRTNAILDVRRAANEYISELLPEGNAYKALLRRETLMFDAIKRLAKSSPELGSTALKRFGQRHPIIKRFGSYGGAAVAGSILGNRILGE